MTPPPSRWAASRTTAGGSCRGTSSAAFRATSATGTCTPPRRSSGARSDSCASTSSPTCWSTTSCRPGSRRGTMRPVMARLAAAFYGYPARDLLMIGVTGTNGKTTVTQLLGDLLTATGRPTNVMGTLSGARTTPEATEIQRVLAGVRDRQRSDGARHAVAMEVSSHALVQSRVEGIHFDVAVFTNLSHDHLDYHGTMEDVLRGEGHALHPRPRLARRRQRRRSVGPAAARARPHPDRRRQPRATPPTSCCGRATPSSPGAASGSRPR